jgi:hypothetical protein
MSGARQACTGSRPAKSAINASLSRAAALRAAAIFSSAIIARKYEVVSRHVHPLLVRLSLPFRALGAAPAGP